MHQCIHLLINCLQHTLPYLISPSHWKILEDLRMGKVIKVSNNGEAYVFKSSTYGADDQLGREIYTLQQIAERWGPSDEWRRIPLLHGFVTSGDRSVGILDDFVDRENLFKLDAHKPQLLGPNKNRFMKTTVRQKDSSISWLSRVGHRAGSGLYSRNLLLSFNLSDSFPQRAARALSLPVHTSAASDRVVYISLIVGNGGVTCQICSRVNLPTMAIVLACTKSTASLPTNVAPASLSASSTTH